MKTFLQKISFVGFSLVVLVGGMPLQAGTDLAFVQECNAMIGSIQNLGSQNSSNTGIITAAVDALGHALSAVDVVVSNPGADADVITAGNAVQTAASSALVAITSNTSSGSNALGSNGPIATLAASSSSSAVLLNGVVRGVAAAAKNLNSSLFQNKTASTGVLASSLNTAVSIVNTLVVTAHNNNFNPANQCSIASAFFNVAQLYSYVVFSSNFTAQADIDAAGQAAINFVAALDSVAALWNVGDSVGDQATQAHAALAAFASYSTVSGYIYNASGTIVQMQQANSAIFNYVAKLMGLKSVTSYAIPGGPGELTIDGNGYFWIVERNLAKIIKMASDGSSYSEIDLDDAMRSVVLGSDGNIWANMQNSAVIAKINTESNAVTYYPVSGTGNTYQSITVGSDGFIWFAENQANKIGKIDPSNGACTEYTVQGPVSVTAGPDGTIWFTSMIRGSGGKKDGSYKKEEKESLGGTPSVYSIGNITSAGSVTLYTVPNSSGIGSIRAAVDGNLWYIKPGNNKIGKCTISGSFTEYNFPNNFGGYIGVGPDGNLWVPESDTNIVYVDITTGVMVEIPIATDAARFWGGIVVGQDGHLWVTDAALSLVDKVVML